VALDWNVRAGAGQNSSRAISNQGRAEAQGGRRGMWETPRASFIPAQGNALGSSAQNPISAESAIHPSSYQPPTTRRQWFQLLFLGLIPMKSQASTNSVLRPCPRSEEDAHQQTLFDGVWGRSPTCRSTESPTPWRARGPATGRPADLPHAAPQNEKCWLTARSPG